jgi:hypothetical protein
MYDSLHDGGPVPTTVGPWMQPLSECGHDQASKVGKAAMRIFERHSVERPKVVREQPVMFGGPSRCPPPRNFAVMLS